MYFKVKLQQTKFDWGILKFELKKLRTCDLQN